MDATQASRFQQLRQYRRRHIDSAEDPALYTRFIEFCDAQVDSVTHVNQYLRYCQTLRKLLPYLRKDMRIAEAGGFCLISSFLKDEGYHCEALSGDFRYEIIAADAQFDLLLSLETLEHIKDQESSDIRKIAVFQFDGMKRYLSELSRVLKPEALLLLSTPNPNSYLVLQRWLSFDPVFMSPVHVRELTRQEILDLSAPWFTVVEYLTMFCFGVLDARKRKRLGEFTSRLGGSVDERGDDHLFVFRKRADAR